MQNRDLREYVDFLRRALPEEDRLALSDAALERVARHALTVREETTWGRSVPEWIFRDYVLFPRINDEFPEAYHAPLWEALRARLAGLSMTEAALEVNVWCAEHVVYQSTDNRTAGPLTTLRRGFGRCGEESTLLTAALRAAGIPARQMYSPRWAHCDDNHAWVEAWLDGRWRYMGACEPEPEPDSGWFTAAASKAMLVHTRAFGEPPEGERVERSFGSFSIVNRTRAYARTRRLTVRVTDGGQPVSGATVRFELANMAELYPISEKLTDAHGEAELETGLGTLRVHATDGRRWLAQTADADRVEIELKEGFGCEPKEESRHPGKRAVCADAEGASKALRASEAFEANHAAGQMGECCGEVKREANRVAAPQGECCVERVATGEANCAAVSQGERCAEVKREAAVGVAWGEVNRAAVPQEASCAQAECAVDAARSEANRVAAPQGERCVERVATGEANCAAVSQGERCTEAGREAAVGVAWGEVNHAAVPQEASCAQAECAVDAARSEANHVAAPQGEWCVERVATGEANCAAVSQGERCTEAGREAALPPTERFVQRPPRETRIQPSVHSEAVARRHAETLRRCERLRAARNAELASDDAVIARARGNAGEIRAFLADVRFAESDRRALLSTLREKDLVDTSAETLADALETALPAKSALPEAIWREAVLCPRIADEKLRPVRRALRDALGEGLCSLSENQRFGNERGEATERGSADANEASRAAAPIGGTEISRERGEAAERGSADGYEAQCAAATVDGTEISHERGEAFETTRAASCAAPESLRTTDASYAARARELWRRIEARVRLVHSDFPLVPDLRAVLKAGRATPLVRDILFAAAARACGIPARLNPADGEKEVWDGAWRPLLPVERGRLRLTNRTGAPRVYGVDFTVGILENGAFRTLNFWGETMDEHWEREVPAGLYRAVHCVRQIDGSVDGELRYARVTKFSRGEMTLEPLPDRTREKLLHRRLPELRAEEQRPSEGEEPQRDRAGEKLRRLPEQRPSEGEEPQRDRAGEKLRRLPELRAEELPSAEGGELHRRAALPPLGRPALLAVLEPGAEPTEHFLNEILELRDEMNGVGLELLIARPGQRENAKLAETLRAVPQARLWTNFDADALLQWRKALDAGDLRLPLAAAFNARGEALFAFTNYNVGSVRALLGCIAADE